MYARKAYLTINIKHYRNKDGNFDTFKLKLTMINFFNCGRFIRGSKILREWRKIKLEK